jgi:hypothetical protein
VPGQIESNQTPLFIGSWKNLVPLKPALLLAVADQKCDRVYRGRALISTIHVELMILMALLL